MTENIPEETRTLIADAIFNRRKIEAIKIHREATGAGLAESKAFIEELTRELQEKAPEKFTSGSSSSAGCGSASLFVLALIGGVAYLVR